jgi:hydrogenase expression/formation protein HypC
MCLAIPTLIKSIDGVQAEVEIGGVSRTISVALTPEAQVGDYVIVHTGFAISVLDEQEAQETLKLFDELAAFEQAELGASARDASTPGGEAGVLGSEAEA